MKNSNQILMAGFIALFFVIAIPQTIDAAYGEMSWVEKPSGLTGNNLSDVSFVSDTVAFALDNSKNIYRTTDSGTTWSLVQTNLNIDYISFTSPTQGFAIAGNSLYVTTNGGIHWSLVQPTKSFDDNSVEDLSFTSTTHGFVLTDESIFKTTNGGTTWSEKRLSNGIAVDFISDTRGWYTTDGGQIYTTSNGGNDWTRVNGDALSSDLIGEMTSLNDLAFTDENNGWVVGHNGFIQYTTNGGTTWSSPITHPTGSVNKTLFGIDFNDKGDALIVGTDGLVLYGTFVATHTWEQQTSSTNINLKDVTFVDANHGWAVGDYKTIIHTADGGKSWSTQLGEGNRFSNLSDVAFANATHGMATGSGTNTGYHTTDGGTTWQGKYMGYADSVHDIFFLDENHGWAVGVPGTIIHTTDAGNSWNFQNNNAPTSIRAESLYGVSFVDANNGWAVGSNGVIIHTTNGGATWERQHSGKGEYLLDVTFTDANNGWTVGRNGVIIHTSNGGETWTSQISNVTYNLYTVSFADAKNGIILGENTTTILVTSDGGVTWIKQIISPTFNPSGVAWIDNTHVVLVGNSGKIFYGTIVTSTTPTTLGVTTIVVDIKKTGGGSDHEYMTKPTFGIDHKTNRQLVDGGFSFNEIPSSV